jgi:hypothetical protein
LNLDFVSTVAEIVAALGVIVSLLYLAKQIRTGSDIEEARAFESAVNSWHQATGNLLVEGNRDVFMKGLAEYDSLTDSETFHFHALSAHFIDRFEIILQFERLGITEKSHLVNMIGPFIRDLLSYSGFQKYWESEAPYFSRYLIEWHQENVGSDKQSATGYAGQIFEKPAD